MPTSPVNALFQCLPQARKHAQGQIWAGWPRVVAFPGLPQIRTCAINASGSSGRGFATRRQHEWIVFGTGRGNLWPKALNQSQLRLAL
jgi:hypothetical protein